MFKLKELRLESGLKRSELARLTGIHQNTLANYENETRQAPYDVLIFLANFFEVTLDELLGRTETPTNPNNIIFTSKERNLVLSYRKLSSLGKEKVEDYVNVITGYENNNNS